MAGVGSRAICLFQNSHSIAICITAIVRGDRSGGLAEWATEKRDAGAEVVQQCPPPCRVESVSARCETVLTAATPSVTHRAEMIRGVPSGAGPLSRFATPRPRCEVAFCDTPIRRSSARNPRSGKLLQFSLPVSGGRGLSYFAGQEGIWPAVVGGGRAGGEVAAGCGGD